MMTHAIYAFISYSRKDKKIADWLHARMESFSYPSDLVIEAHRPPHKKYIRPVFLDTKDLKVEERPFNEGIKEKLRQSRYLIVICSKNSAISPYVDMEIRFFLETHDNNYSLIVPLFVDEVDHSIPPAFSGTSIMSRHFPIYNSMLGETSEANQYCFLQLTAYLLGIDFSDIYNRYEVYSASEHRKLVRRYVYAILFCGICVLGLISYIAKQRQVIEKDAEIIEKGRELVRFEREVFPAAVVFGYEANFLRPVIKYMKEAGKTDFKVCVFLPRTERELREHQNRAIDFSLLLQENMIADSLIHNTLPTSMRRGSRVLKIARDGSVDERYLIDFATTTSSFLKVAEHKQMHPAYKDKSLNELIEEYSIAFIEKTKEQLETDSVYVSFFMSAPDFIEFYKNYGQGKTE